MSHIVQVRSSLILTRCHDFIFHKLKKLDRHITPNYGKAWKKCSLKMISSTFQRAVYLKLWTCTTSVLALEDTMGFGRPT